MINVCFLKWEAKFFILVHTYSNSDNGIANLRRRIKAESSVEYPGQPCMFAHEAIDKLGVESATESQPSCWHKVI